MSMPNIPDINPEITLKRKEAINLLLTSIAMEEIGFSHIINAEAEKIQYILQDRKHHMDDLLLINNSVAEMLRHIASNQILLQFKLMDVIKLDRQSKDEDDDNEFEECFEE